VAVSVLKPNLPVWRSLPDGKMIDVPVVRRAERLLERHAAIAEREARTSGG
jgi:hypothetical protein